MLSSTNNKWDANKSDANLTPQIKLDFSKAISIEKKASAQRTKNRERVDNLT